MLDLDNCEKMAIMEAEPMVADMVKNVPEAQKAEASDWVISSDNKDYRDDKVYYICRWLNRSFRPFSRRQEREYQHIREAYIRKHNESK